MRNLKTFIWVYQCVYVWKGRESSRRFDGVARVIFFPEVNEKLEIEEGKARKSWNCWQLRMIGTLWSHQSRWLLIKFATISHFLQNHAVSCEIFEIPLLIDISLIIRNDTYIYLLNCIDLSKINTLSFRYQWVLSHKFVNSLIFWFFHLFSSIHVQRL